MVLSLSGVLAATAFGTVNADVRFSVLMCFNVSQHRPYFHFFFIKFQFLFNVG